MLLLFVTLITLLLRLLFFKDNAKDVVMLWSFTNKCSDVLEVLWRLNYYKQESENQKPVAELNHELNLSRSEQVTVLYSTPNY